MIEMYAAGYVLALVLLFFVILVQNGKIQKKDVIQALGYSFFSWMMVAISLIVLVVSLVIYEAKDRESN